MTTIKAHVSSVELEARYKTAVDPVGKSHFHALWLLSSGYEVDEVAELLSFSPRWVRALIKRYNEGGAGALGDQRVHNGTKPWLARFHGVRSVHDQRGWDALIAIGYSIQRPRPRHPDAATDADRAALKKSLRPRLTRSGASIQTRALKSGRWMNIASV